MPAAGAKNTPLARIREFFGMDLKAMKAEWTQGNLTVDDKKQLTDGVVAFYEELDAGEREKFLNNPRAKKTNVLMY